MRRIVANTISFHSSRQNLKAVWSRRRQSQWPSTVTSSVVLRYTQTSSTSSSSPTSSTSHLETTTTTTNHRDNVNDDPTAVAGEVAVDDTAINSKEFAKANYQKIHGRQHPVGVFPWRHSPLPLPRLDIGSDEFERKGYLLGGDIVSSNPTADSYATAFLFMKASIFDLFFFKAYKGDLAESMSWAFGQGVSSILSNVYSREYAYCDVI